MYARPIQQLIQAFSKLPGVGPRTAERFVAHLLKSGKKDVAELSSALQYLMSTTKSCTSCWDFSDRSPCALCTDTTRDQTLLCIVAEPHDLQALEHTGTYRGYYHVLRGTIDPIDEEQMRGLKIKELLSRIQAAGPFREIILAFNPDVAGETTILALTRLIREGAPRLTVTRLARGLPMGSDLRYADDITLGNAIAHRVKT